MQVFYEEEGAFRVGNVLADNVASLQVEAASGKRTKVKSANVLLRFEDGSIGDFVARAQAVADAIDTDFLWECCGPDEFGFDALGRDYFGRAPTPVESAGLVLRLHNAPMYFYKRGRGRYRAAPEDALKAALASVERKKREAEAQDRYVEDLVAGTLPEPFRAQLSKLLYKPDRATIEARAFQAAGEALGLTPTGLLRHCGALPSAHDFHLDRFVFEHFPGGLGFPSALPEPPPAELPLGDAAAFSIDDSTTTEIDDAFTVAPLPGGGWKIGVHIAAPAVGIPPGSELDGVARARLSTVYMPGRKLTMLPPGAIEAYTLAEGRECPALSLYIDIGPDYVIRGRETRLDRVRIAHNLRHDQLEDQFNERTLAEGTPDIPYGERLEVLWRFATVLQAARGATQDAGDGRVEYSFYVEAGRVRIAERRRGSPLDTLVAELMILANTEWGKLLADKGVAGIYRAQSQGKVRMTTAPAPHEGLGVDQYAWSSSPIRRYVDLLNQRQLLAAIGGTPPPYRRNDATLIAAMREFELAYDAYNEFQRSMERFWCLRWLEQEQVTVCRATVIRDSLVRFERIPLVVRVPSVPGDLPRDTRIEIAVTGMDLYDLEVTCEFRGTVMVAAADDRLDAATTAPPSELLPAAT